MLTKDDVQILTAYFAPEDHEFLQGNAYITEAAITARIEEVDPAWTFAIMATQQRGEKITVTASLTVKGVSRDNIGMAEIRQSRDGDKEVNEPEKAAATDALKRCARLFGIGRYLLTLPRTVNDEKSLARWMNGSTPSKATPAPVKAETPTVEPVEDVVIAHVAKRDKNGRTFHVLSTRDHGNISIWTRQMFQDALWVDDMDWLEVDRPTKNLDIPVMVKPDGDYWAIVEVATCTL